MLSLEFKRGAPYPSPAVDDDALKPSIFGVVSIDAAGLVCISCGGICGILPLSPLEFIAMLMRVARFDI